MGAPEVKFISLLNLVMVLVYRKRIVIGIPVAAAVMAFLLSLLLPNLYTATARLMPPQPNQSAAAAILGQLGPLSNLVGGSLGVRNPSDLYVGMLRSRTIADRLIERFDLQKIYDQPTLVDTRRAFERKINIWAGRDGIIVIAAEDESPQRAADIANAIVEELSKLNDTLAITEASQRRVFFEKQLKQAKDALTIAEVELKKTQEATGLIKLDDQGRAIIEAVSRLKAQIVLKEVQIGAMKGFATERNADFVVAHRELEGFRDQLRKLERDNASGNGNILIPTGRVPEAGLEYVRKFRDMKYHETVFELLARQFELARMDEAKDTSFIQLLDRAMPPDKKSAPRRGLIALLIGFLAGTLTVAFVLIQHALRAPT
jgi:tyrosine-protein kinase Etk/Wzc